jgi:hypothetical protein
MDQTTFDRYVRRAAGVLDRRSVLAGWSGALLAGVSGPLAAEAKKGKNKSGDKKRKNCKQRAELCRQEFLENCEDEGIRDSEGCINEINACCRRAATCKLKSEDKIIACGANVLCRHGAVIGGFCD